MLALRYIRENKEVLLKGLEKRGFKTPEIIDQIINLDKNRRTKQAKLDTLLAESNETAKEIGVLFKSGKAEEANTLKEKSIAWILNVLTKKPIDILVLLLFLNWYINFAIPSLRNIHSKKNIIKLNPLIFFL